MINERKLAFKYLCKKKRRSITTLFAIIIAVFLIFVSGNLILSAYYAFQQSNLKAYGDYVAYLKDFQIEKIPDLEKEGAVLRALENKLYDVGELERQKDWIQCEFHYFEDFSDFPFYYEITEGSIPTKPGEIMLHEKWKYYLGESCNIGDTITLSVREYELDETTQNFSRDKITKTYTLAGYYDASEDCWLANSVVLVKDEERNSDSLYRAYFDSTEEGYEGKEDWAVNIGFDIGNKTKVNLIYQNADGIEGALIYLLMIIAGIIIGGFAAIVIRNAFVISVVERTRDYGMLRCVGASKRQIRNVAFYEAIMLWVTGEVIGLIISYLFLYGGINIAKEYFYLSEDFRLVQQPVLVIGTCLITFAVTLFGLLEPARQINQLRPLDALRNQKDVKKERIRTGRKNGGLVGKIFGVEGEYAYKNLIRNRKKFITMTANSIISIAVFVGVNGTFIYTEQIYKASEIEYPDYNARILFQEYGSDSIDSVEENLKNIRGVSNVVVSHAYCYRIGDGKIIVKEDGSGVYVDVYIVATNETGDFIPKDSVLEGELKKLDVGECYIINGCKDEDGMEILEHYDIVPGGKIEVAKERYGKETEEGIVSELDIVAVLKEHPVQAILDYEVIMLMSEEGFQALCQEQGIKYKETGEIYFKIDGSCDVNKVQELVEDNGMLFDDYQYDERTLVTKVKRIQLTVNIILILIALISFANLSNSMESNLILREKERQILRAVGMSHKQYVKMILLEGMLSVLIALIIGTALGIIFGYGIFRILYPFWRLQAKKLKFMVPIFSIVFAGVGLTLLTVLSSISGIKKEDWN